MVFYDGSVWKDFNSDKYKNYLKRPGNLLSINTDWLCGFLGHSAKLGCNKCLKQFANVEDGDKRDYSGVNGNSEQKFLILGD